MSLTKKTFLGIFLGLGGLGWVAGVAMTVQANSLAQDNRALSAALTSSFIQRASLVHQLEQLKSQQQADAVNPTSLQVRPAVSD